MPGWYGHDIDLQVDTSGLRANIDLASPCDVLAVEVNADLAEIGAKANAGKSSIISEIAEASRDTQVQALTSYGSNKTGTLAGSITPEVSGSHAHVGTDLFYAEYVHDGRGSVSAGEGVLHFFNDGEEVFVKSVGPSSPRPYTDDTGMLDMRIEEIMNSFMESIL
ncbi:MAG: hypothetical protein J6V44_03605 [Methanobrevibacter sp.]|nr:hypothetical protein [Methanobrevibacter sp.]